MANKYIKSKRTDRDLKDILIWGITNFGEVQTDTYMAELHSKMQLLAKHPDIGRKYTHKRTQKRYLCFPYKSHIIYYRKRASDIFIIRILHKKMLPMKYL